MLRITKDSILHVELDEDENEEISNIIDSENGIVSFLDQFVTFEEALTIGDFIKVLMDFEESIDYVFDSGLNGQSLSTFAAELNETTSHDGALSYLEIVHDVELDSEGILSEIKYFQGIGPSPVDGHMTPFSLELLPLSYYKDLPLILNHNYVVQRIEIVKDIPMHFIELKALKGFTLYEIIHSVLFEISFHGTPTERATMLVDILEICQQATGQPVAALALPAAASTGKDAEMARLSEELNKAIETENYESAVIIRDKIKSLGGDR